MNNDKMDPEKIKRMEENRKIAIEKRKRNMENELNANPATHLNSIPTVKNDFPKPNIQSNSVSKINNSSNVNTELPKFNMSKNVVPMSKMSPNKFGYTEIKKRPHENDNNQNIYKSPKKNHEKHLNSPGKVQEKKSIELSVQLESGSRFKVDVKYVSEIIKIFQQVSSKQWDPKSKIWSFSLKDYNHIMKELNNLSNINIKYVNLIQESVIKSLNNISYPKIDLKDNLDENFIESLYPYQKAGIIFGIQREGKCLIADDMGLGKTVQAIGLAKWYRKNWPLIIICPSSLRYQWMHSILKWMPEIKEKDIFVAINTKDIFPKVPITITSYDVLSRIRNRFTVDTNRFYNMIIMDESHYIKSELTQRTSTTALIARSCSRIILLTGTPALSRPIELFPQLNIINSELFPSKHAFGLRYCDAQQKRLIRNGKPIVLWDYNGAKNLDELKIILENTIMIRRLKKDVLNELPSKKREMICLSTDYLDPKSKEQLAKFKQKIRYNKAEVFTWFTKSAEAKIQAVNEYLSDILTKDVKFICFCHHKMMLDGIQEMLNKKKINHIRIDGSTNAKARQEACEVFQSKESFKVALLSITACATGLNLTSSSMVIFAEIYWNPGILAQAEDRAHRIGQSKHVQVIYLVSRGTIDELIWPLISRKLDILNKAGLCRDTFNDTVNLLELSEDQSLITEFLNYLEKDEDKANNDNNKIM